ncbi:RNA polymerase sigma factor [Actinokineospora bangkokensis]|uniref:RNA polymerase subunit sigma-24 n=1 Tax=Actinokineospora bangkokensis TaxID=1193682 RepID=A0A1Q9LJP1_9PSEU|nr:sigma-70 family RNA polymerase sigma factor [Actinokineospora bangkokensis]OLR92199.1 RNA polymerase subunit sigma-24 [Actinokineospora bangkokensis]
MTGGVEDLLREHAPRVLALLVRRHGRFDMCEDAVQEALLAAGTQWPRDGVPANPWGWLVAVASNKLTDAFRAETARARREVAAARADPTDAAEVPAADDTLDLLFLCCHPALTEPSRVALTLRAVGGLTTAQIAAAFLVPEATMGQRITRAKLKIRDAGLTGGGDPAARVGAVLHVLYLVFNEGHTASSGADLARPELTTEAIRVTRLVHTLAPRDGEVAGLLALMLLTEARRPARTRPDGSLVPLAEQDRARWDRAMIAEGSALVEDAMSWAPLGPYQLQAAIAALHATAPDTAATDWPQIAVLYRILERLTPSPVVTVHRAVAVAEAHGPAAGLALLATIADDPRMRTYHRFAAVQAHLLERAGDPTAAQAAYRRAARLTLSTPEKRYLERRAAALG